MFKQSDAFSRAAECAQLMSLEVDEVQKSAHQSLAEMWIDLASESTSMNAAEFARQFGDLDQIQTRFQKAKTSQGKAS